MKKHWFQTRARRSTSQLRPTLTRVRRCPPPDGVVCTAHHVRKVQDQDEDCENPKYRVQTARAEPVDELLHNPCQPNDAQEASDTEQAAHLIIHTVIGHPVQRARDWSIRSHSRDLSEPGERNTGRVTPNWPTEKGKNPDAITSSQGCHSHTLTMRMTGVTRRKLLLPYSMYPTTTPTTSHRTMPHAMGEKHTKA